MARDDSGTGRCDSASSARIGAPPCRDLEIRSPWSRGKTDMHRLVFARERMHPGRGGPIPGRQRRQGLHERRHREQRNGLAATGGIMTKASMDRNPDILGGTPVFSCTRVPVRILMENLEANVRLDEFPDDFPAVSRDHAVTVLRAAGEMLAATFPDSFTVRTVRERRAGPVPATALCSTLRQTTDSMFRSQWTGAWHTGRTRVLCRFRPSSCLPPATSPGIAATCPASGHRPSGDLHWRIHHVSARNEANLPEPSHASDEGCRVGDLSLHRIKVVRAKVVDGAMGTNRMANGSMLVVIGEEVVRIRGCEKPVSIRES